MARDGGGFAAGGGGVSMTPSPPHAPGSDVENEQQEQEQEQEQEQHQGQQRSSICRSIGNADCSTSSPPVSNASIPLRRPVHMLLIDNYDSYTYNLFQLMSMVNGAQPDVLHNDAMPWPELRSRIIEKREWDGVVISPGPGTPLVPGDVGVCAQLLVEAASAASNSSSSSSPSSPLFPPILGVCLGMQALAHACGGVVLPAPEPIHGRLSLVAHCGSSPLFAGVPREPEETGKPQDGGDEKEEAAAAPTRPFRVVRYHSLAVEEGSLPACLRATAWTVGGTVAVETKSAKKAAAHEAISFSSSSTPSQRVLMALEHASLPLFGVQFHPESVATSYGDALFANFRDLVAERAGLEKGRFVAESVPTTPGPPTPAPPTPPVRASPAPPAPPSSSSSSGSSRAPFPCPGPFSTLELCWKKVEGCLESAGGTEALFLRLFNSIEGEEEEGGAATAATTATARPPPPSSSPSPHSLRLLDHGAPDVWWLDTATSDRGRFSFMGGGPSGGHAGPLWSRAVYRLGGGRASAEEKRKSSSSNSGTLSVTTRDGSSRSTSSSTSVFDALEQQLRACAREPEPALPFDFQGGFVALLGYELKAECGGAAAHSSAAVAEGSGGEGTATPDAAFYFADRMLAADHRTGDVYCLALYEQKKNNEKEEEGGEEDSSAEGKEEALSWVSGLCSRVRALAAEEKSETLPPPLASVPVSAVAASDDSPPPIQQPFRVRRGKETYLGDVRSCLGALARGESYELCLTTRLERSGPPPPALALYRTLRRGNPAPYSAFIALGGDEGGEKSSSSFSSFSSVDGYCGPRICCSSPERFLRGDSLGRLEARPIKGTARRVLPKPGDENDERALASTAADDAAVAAALASSEKDRAENLMIVDLLRNDLGRVSEPGSVSVPGLMEVETFATVHQLVSTVVGVARGMGGGGAEEEGKGPKRMGWARAVAAAADAADAAAAGACASSPPPSSLPTESAGGVTSAVAAIRAAFPGGSMTGAPKVRSMALLDDLESGARGLYSGSLGFLSTTGAFDLNIVIRTAVVLPRAAAEAAANEAEKETAKAAAEAEAEDGASSSRRRHRLLPPGISIGAGGAVVLQSTPEGEYEEMLLKAGALLAAVSKVTTPTSGSSSSSAAVEVEVED